MDEALRVGTSGFVAKLQWYDVDQHSASGRKSDFRRKGLALSLVAIVIAMAGLFLAVRRLEGRG
jgi:hypothetical protein